MTPLKKRSDGLRKLLNVLYVTSSEAYLSRDGENVVVRSEKQEQIRLPIHTLESIVCFNYTGMSPALMGLCAERGVKVSFLTQNGKFLAKVHGSVTGNVLLRRKQYRMADDQKESTKMAIYFISAKMANSKIALQRVIRDHGQSVDTVAVSNAVKKIAQQMERLQRCTNLDSVRGIEGEAARTYFSVFNEMIVAQKEDFSLKERNRRPPLDYVNALLSFLYTLLTHDMESALETVGVDPYVGFLHRDRPGRPSLALDMMEELRPYLSDRIVLSLINLKQITAKGFYEKESGGIIMDSDTRKVVLTAWQKRKQQFIMHPFLNEKIPIGLIPYVQALLLARYLRGDLDGYPAFFWR